MMTFLFVDMIIFRCFPWGRGCRLCGEVFFPGSHSQGDLSKHKRPRLSRHLFETPPLFALLWVCESSPPVKFFFLTSTRPCDSFVI